MAAAKSKSDKTGAGAIRVGVGGWTYEPWRGAFYPEKWPQKNELAYAASKLTSIEINGTFYGSQKPKSFARWRDETPEGFVFSVKAPRFVVQKRVLAETGESITRFIDGGLGELREKLGPILWQFAPTKKFDAADFSAFLDLLPRELASRPLRHALEVRHDSFACEEFVALARKHDAAIVTACDSDYPQIADATADFFYLRIMGADQKAKLGYAPKALDLWASRCQAISRGDAVDGLHNVSTKAHVTKPRDVFCYFISGFKQRNPAAAMALIERLT